MKAFNVILGILAIFGAIYYISFPGIAFLSTGWFITIWLAAWGLCAVFEYVSKKKKEGKSSKKSIVLGILGIVAAIAVALIMTMPRFSLVVDIAIMIIFSIWMIINGIISIYTSVISRKLSESHMWIFTLILGIIVLIAGAYGLFHMFVLARAIGLMMGILIMVYGIRLILSVFEPAE